MTNGKKKQAKELLAIHNYLGKHDPKPVCIIANSSDDKFIIYKCCCGNWFYDAAETTYKVNSINAGQHNYFIRAIIGALNNEDRESFESYLKSIDYRQSISLSDSSYLSGNNGWRKYK
jgi:hypothetical protein